MKDILAETLLVKVMNWKAAKIREHRPVLQALARYMYDEYQQFSPGMRFIASLALWLDQFDFKDREMAYQFVRAHLLFIGESELKHLINIVFPDCIQPLLIEETSKHLDLPKWAVRQSIKNLQYKVILRQSLFLGLSDGAHIDLFRRSNPVISNEQIWSTYEVTETKRQDLVSKLNGGLKGILGLEPSEQESRFKMIFLLDDFSASGRSYFRNENGEYKGKIPKVLSAIFKQTGNLYSAVDPDSCQIHVLLYVATDTAVSHIQLGMDEWLKENNLSNKCTVRAIQSLPSGISLTHQNNAAVETFLKQYFDESIVDSHFKKGKCDRPYLGFDECGLPLILSHNSPNNSLPILWFEETRAYRGLFPRVSRHKQDS